MMKVERVTKQMPPRLPSRLAEAEKVDPQAGGDRLIWEALIPRLLHPAKVVVLEAFLRVRKPMSAVGLAAMLEDPSYFAGSLAYHLGEMRKAGIVEVVETWNVRGADEAFFYFPEKPQSAHMAGCSVEAGS